MTEPRAGPSPAHTAHQLYQKKCKIHLIPHESSIDIQLQKSSPKFIEYLTGVESFFSSDEYLIPVIEDDPLIRAYVSTCLSYDAQ